MIPGIDARVAHLEKQSIIVGGNIEELRSQMQLGFEQAHAYIEEHVASKEDLRKLEDRVVSIEANLKEDLHKLEDRVVSIEANLKEDLHKLEDRVVSIETSLKNDMVAMEDRIITVIKQLLRPNG